MKITKKDKTLLLVLLVILVVGIFIMYGLIPAYNDLKEQKTKLAELQAEVNKLINNFNKHNPARIEGQIEKALMEYYTNEADLDSVVSKFDAYSSFMDDLTVFCANNNIAVPEVGSVSNVVSDSSLTVNDKAFSVYKASVRLDYTYDGMEPLYNVIDELSNDYNYMYSNLIINQVKQDFSDSYTINGSFVLEKYYLIDSKAIPQMLVQADIKAVKDAPTIVSNDTKNKEITFSKVENAVYYQIYKAVKNADGSISYSLAVKRINDDPDSANIKYNYSGLPKGDYIVTAVGNYLESDVPSGSILYYRTILSKYLYQQQRLIQVD